MEIGRKREGERERERNREKRKKEREKQRERQRETIAPCLFFTKFTSSSFLFCYMTLLSYMLSTVTLFDEHVFLIFRLSFFSFSCLFDFYSDFTFLFYSFYFIIFI